MNRLCGGIVVLLLMTACDLSPGALLGNRAKPEASPARDAAPETFVPVSAGSCAEVPVLMSEPSNEDSCSSHPGGLVALVGVTLGNSLLFRTSHQEPVIAGVSTHVFPAVKAVTFRHARSSRILHFACRSPYWGYEGDLSVCRPTCISEFYELDQGSGPCRPVHDFTLDSDSLGAAGDFVAYSVEIEHSPCGVTVFWDKFRGGFSERQFCDDKSHLRKIDEGENRVTIPSFSVVGGI